MGSCRGMRCKPDDVPPRHFPHVNDEKHELGQLRQHSNEQGSRNEQQLSER